MGDRSGRSVLVDARALRASGIGRYIQEIIPYLVGDPRFTRVTLLGDVADLREFVGEHSGGCTLRFVPLPSGFYRPRYHVAWLQRQLRGECAADVAFFPHYDAPLVTMPANSVVAVQDLTHFKVPEAFPPLKRAVAGFVFDRVVSRAKHILVSSHSTRRDLVDRAPETAQKIELIPLGVSATFGIDERGADAPVVPQYPYVLCVGNRKRHKNLAVAVEALAQVRERWPELRLVVVGRVFPEWEEVRRQASSLGVLERIVELDRVSDHALQVLYARAEALLFPSLYEGFGLPVLEAMACGAPVIASARASLPEVVGDAGLLVDPEDVQGWTSAIERLRAQPDIRRDLVRKGRERARQFTWKKAAQNTVEALCRTAARNG